MKVLITMELSDNKLYRLCPISLLDEVDQILVVRRKKGPEINKVKYFCPPNFIAKNDILSTIYKGALLMYISIKERPVLIHSFLLFPHGVLAFIAGKITRRKVGVSLIAGPMEIYSGLGSPEHRYTYTKPLPNLPMKAKITLYILKKFDVITVTGSFTRDFLKKNGLPEDKIYILPHRIEDCFRPEPLEKVYDIIYIGRLDAIKHIDAIIKAIPIVKVNYPNIHVAIVGDGPQKDKLERISDALGLSGNIFFVGYQKDTNHWLNSSKISTLMSEREGFPCSVIEAMKCGVPVITTACGDILDVVSHNYNGIVIDDYEDHERLAQEIVELLRSSEKREFIGNNAIQSLSAFSEENINKIWYHIVDSLASSPEK